MAGDGALRENPGMRPSPFPGLRRLVLLAVAVCLALAGCDRGPGPEETGLYELPDGQVRQYDTAYIAAVQVPTDDADGHILLRNNWDNTADLGGWALVGRNNRTIPLPPSTFIQPNGELRVHLAEGDSDEDDLYVGAEEEVLPWDRLRLVDAAGETVARFSYGR